jgi:hypothetical protein
MLTPAQLATLRTFVANSADAAIVAARQAGATYDLTTLLNAAHAPATSAWRTEVAAQVLDDAATYTTYDGKTQGKRDEWSILLQYAPRDMSRDKNRNVVVDVWGNANAGSVGEAILQACVESATVAQVAIGGSNKTTGTVTALARDFTGQVTQDESRAILAA